MHEFVIQPPNNDTQSLSIISSDKTITYGQLINSIVQVSKRLIENGINPNDRVVVFDVNSVEYVIVYFALLNIKSIPCLLSTRNPHEFLKKQIKDLNCVAIVSFMEDVLQSNLGEIKKISFDELIDLNKENNEDFSRNIKISHDQIASIIYTSGSTSNPKAAVHSAENYLYSAQGSNENIHLEVGDRWLLSLPLYHVGGLSILYRSLLAGAAVFIKAKDESIDDILENQRVTHISLVPTQLHRLLENDKLKKNVKVLKAVLIGGNKPSVKLLQRALDVKLPLYLTYGLTEMSSQVATSRLESVDKNEALSVKVLKSVEVQIRNDGEVWVRGKTLFKGYIEHDKINPKVDKDGWFFTGDLGVLNKDGSLSISGRKDNVFISGGENIHPEEIEESLMQITGIEKAIVISIPDEEFGERPVAFLTHHKKNQLQKNQIIELLRDNIAGFKIPKKYYYLPEEFDKDLKISRPKLRRMYLEGQDAFQEIL